MTNDTTHDERKLRFVDGLDSRSLSHLLVKDVIVGERMRPVDDDKRLEDIKQSIRDNGGLLEPITVYYQQGVGYRLIEGAYRLEAIKQIQAEEIERYGDISSTTPVLTALVHNMDQYHGWCNAGEVEDRLKLMELDANLARKDLTAEERMTWNAKRVDLKRRIETAVKADHGLSPRGDNSKHGDNSKSGDNPKRGRKPTPYSDYAKACEIPDNTLRAQARKWLKDQALTITPGKMTEAQVESFHQWRLNSADEAKAKRDREAKAKADKDKAKADAEFNAERTRALSMLATVIRQHREKYGDSFIVEALNDGGCGHLAGSWD